jgi:hypothetical protein
MMKKKKTIIARDALPRKRGAVGLPRMRPLRYEPRHGQGRFVSSSALRVSGFEFSEWHSAPGNPSGYQPSTLSYQLIRMSDSQFLYHLMLRVNEARAKYPRVPMWALFKEVTDLQKELESGGNIERLREEAIDVACVALRMAVEGWKQ